MSDADPLKRQYPETKPENVAKHGFEGTMPEELFGVDCIVFECGIQEDEELGCNYSETVDIDPTEVKLKGNGLLEFPDAVPRECPECGEYMHHRYNGLGVSFDV